MNIAIIGTGYVGLVSGTCFAEMGNQVTCVDIDTEKVRKLKAGVVPIYEPGLSLLFEKNVAAGRLSFTTDLKEGVQDATVVMLALPTPPGEDGSADLQYVLKVSEDLSHIITDYKVIVGKSTVPVGTAEKVEAILQQKLDPSLYDVVSNPEFLREGFAVEDFMKPDRVVIGTDSEKARNLLQKLYAPFVRQGNPIIFMSRRSSELTKYAANSYLATRITFMNEMANLSEKLGANVDDVRRGMATDSRIGPKFLYPGIGYGGSCFPKDVKALCQTADQNGYPLRLLNSVEEVNERQKTVLVDKMDTYYDGEMQGKKFAIWGLAFKPNTDDIREAPAIVIMRQLLDKGAELSVYDPEAMSNIRALFGDKIHYAADQYEALEAAEALVVCTEWSIFRSPNFDKMKELMNHHVIFDGRNIFDYSVSEVYGFHYESIGRPAGHV